MLLGLRYYCLLLEIFSPPPLTRTLSLSRACALSPLSLSPLSRAVHISPLVRLCPRHFEDVAALAKRCNLHSEEDVSVLEAVTLLLQKMTTVRTMLARASSRIYSSKLLSALQDLKHRLRAEVPMNPQLRFVEMNVGAVVAAIDGAIRTNPLTSMMIRGIKDSPAPPPRPQFTRR